MDDEFCSHHRRQVIGAKECLRRSFGSVRAHEPTRAIRQRMRGDITNYYGTILKYVGVAILDNPAVTHSVWLG